MSFLLLLATVLLDFLGTLVANLIVVGPWHIVSSSFCLSLFRYIFNAIATSLYFSLRLSKFSDAEFLFWFGSRELHVESTQIAVLTMTWRTSQARVRSGYAPPFGLFVLSMGEFLIR